MTPTKPKGTDPEWTAPSDEELAVLRRQLDSAVTDGDSIMAEPGEVPWGPWETSVSDLIKRALGPDPWPNSFQYAGFTFGGTDTRRLAPSEAVLIRVRERNESLGAKLQVARQALRAIDQDRERRGVRQIDAPTLPTEAFAFIASKPLQAIAQRDYDELRASTRTVKARAILAGSIVEAVLTDALQRAGYAQKQTDAMSFKELIRESQDAKVITPRTAKAADSLRDFRNLVHPAVELRDGRLRPAEADAAVSLMRLVLEDLR